MNEKEEWNLTLPIILIGLLTIGLFVFFNISNSGKDYLTSSTAGDAGGSLTASAVHFIAPDRVVEGDYAEFSWKADVSEGAACVGKTEPDGSDGGWVGSKSTEGVQKVGPIELNTTYFLDCTDGEKMVRDVELVSVVKPKISFLASKNTLALNEKAELSWDAINVKECSLFSEGKLLYESLNGSYSASGLTKTTEFTLTCKTAKDSVSETIEIVVEE